MENVSYSREISFFYQVKAGGGGGGVRNFEN